MADASLVAGKLNEADMGLTFRVEDGRAVANISADQLAKLSAVYQQNQPALSKAFGPIDIAISDDKKKLIIDNGNALKPEDLENFKGGRHGNPQAVKAAFDTGDATKVADALQANTTPQVVAQAPANAPAQGAAQAQGTAAQGAGPSTKRQLDALKMLGTLGSGKAGAAATFLGALGALGSLGGKKDKPAQQPGADAPAAGAPAGSETTPTAPAAQADKTVKSVNNGSTGLTFERVDGKVVAKLTPEETAKVAEALTSLTPAQKKDIFGTADIKVNESGKIEFANADDLTNKYFGAGIMAFNTASKADGKIKTFMDRAKSGGAAAANPGASKATPPDAPASAAGQQTSSAEMPDYAAILAAGASKSAPVASEPTALAPVVVAEQAGPAKVRG